MSLVKNIAMRNPKLNGRRTSQAWLVVGLASSLVACPGGHEQGTSTADRRPSTDVPVDAESVPASRRSPSPTAPPRPDPGEPFSLLFASDAHFKDGQPQKLTNNAEVVEEMIRLRTEYTPDQTVGETDVGWSIPHAVVLLGDMTSMHTPTEFTDFEDVYINPLRTHYPTYVTMGNHDISPIPHPGNNQWLSKGMVPVFDDIEASAKAFRAPLGYGEWNVGPLRSSNIESTAYTFEHENYLFIQVPWLGLVDSYCCASNVVGANQERSCACRPKVLDFDSSCEPTDFLSDELVDACERQRRQRVGFSDPGDFIAHQIQTHPNHEIVINIHEPKGLNTRDQIVTAIVENRNVVALFSGHLHGRRGYQGTRRFAMPNGREWNVPLFRDGCAASRKFLYAGFSTGNIETVVAAQSSDRTTWSYTKNCTVEFEDLQPTDTGPRVVCPPALEAREPQLDEDVWNDEPDVEDDGGA